jgi:DNA-binding transcriptional LysR family regulator
LNDLAIFVKVVECGGFTAAASHLQISPALASRRVSELEHDIGAQLINRSTRHLILTEVGEGFYAECVHALSVIDEARRAAVCMVDEPRGTLRLHSAVGVGHGLVTEALTLFKQRYPTLLVDLHISTERVNSLQHGYDLIIRTADLPESGLECCLFGSVRRVIVAAPSYLERKGAPTRPEDLARFDCLVLYGRRPPNEWKFLGPNGVYTVKINGTFRSTSALAVYMAALNGLGIARVPEYVMYGRADAGRLRVLFDDCLMPERTLKAYYPRTRHLPAKVRAFLECLREVDAAAKLVTLPAYAAKPVLPSAAADVMNHA